jgi:hypothetical protein
LLNPLIEPLAFVARRTAILSALLLPITIGFIFEIHVADFFDSEHSLCEYTKPDSGGLDEYQQN